MNVAVERRPDVVVVRAFDDRVPWYLDNGVYVVHPVHEVEFWEKIGPLLE